MDPRPHEHSFLGRGHAENTRRSLVVIGITAAMMVVEIVGGAVFGSMALLADGFHMATHAGALSITALAYRYAERHAADARFTFGTGKVGDLAGFASAIVLATIALWIGYESCMRLANPVAIAFDEAIGVAVLGLLVNVVCAALLGGAHDHDCGHERDWEGDQEAHHAHFHRDHNLRSAYLHVLADALTSVFAIAGLLAGRFLGWAFMDPIVGIAGAIMIARWSAGLMRDTGAVLLDQVPSANLLTGIRTRIERDGDEVVDLHVWRVGPGHAAAIVAVRTDRPRTPESYRQQLADLPHLSHVTIEVTVRRGG